MPETLLVIEDEDLLGDELVRHYRDHGWDAVRTPTLQAARALLFDQELDPLVVLSDMSLPDGNALDLLESVRRDARTAEWILLTGYGTVPDSVRALRLGAYDFVEKPCPTERLDLIVAGAARSSQAQRRLRDQAVEQNRRYAPESFVGPSAASQRVRELLHKLAAVPISALVIGGETGTGKGLAARILHHSGTRAAGPLVEVNCAALPSDLLESELFGHEAGSFTGAKGRHRGLIEQAHGGTLFLDEIGEVSLGLQAKLLRALEDRRIRRLGGEREIEVDVQILAASNRDLAAAVEQGTFRHDLYHRLCVFRLDLPPLRERYEDLERLVTLFVAEYNGKSGKHVRVIPPEVWSALRGHAWPGNVRELRNVVERCVLFAEDDRFPSQWLQLRQAARRETAPQADPDAVRVPLDGSMSLDEVERFVLERALERFAGNVSAAARSLGLSRQTLRYRMQKHGLGMPQRPPGPGAADELP
ncbi:MAG TPA: sigma-54 dependent transcriptional regulator [Myxococcota bacterium]|nr:sigma-54 dependent transcriptional regulator [Myxococcota bacterium]